MTIAPLTKQQIYKALDTLSPDALAEVARVVNTLQRRAKSPLHLAGRWANIPFDIDHRTVRSLRRSVSRRALRRNI